MIEIMRETKVTIRKNILLDWLYKQKKEVSVEEIKDFIEKNKEELEIQESDNQY